MVLGAGELAGLLTGNVLEALGSDRNDYLGGSIDEIPM